MWGRGIFWELSEFYMDYMKDSNGDLRFGIIGLGIIVVTALEICVALFLALEGLLCVGGLRWACHF